MGFNFLIVVRVSWSFYREKLTNLGKKNVTCILYHSVLGKCNMLRKNRGSICFKFLVFVRRSVSLERIKGRLTQLTSTKTHNITWVDRRFCQKKKLINLSKPEANSPIIGDFALATSRTLDFGSKSLKSCFVVGNYVYFLYF